MRDLALLNQSERSVFLNGLALMSQIFWGPTRDTCADMMQPQFLLELAELSQLIPGPGGEAAVSLASCLENHPGPGELLAHLEENYVPLFVSHREGICAPLYQSCYENEDGLLMGRPAAMMSQRLEAAGLSLEGRSGEPLDHLAVEVEYCLLLLEKAFVDSDPALLDAARCFAEEEMLPWMQNFRDRLSQKEDCLIYPLAAEILVALVALAAENQA